jgi:hypothetical protein
MIVVGTTMVDRTGSSPTPSVGDVGGIYSRVAHEYAELGPP